MQKGGFTIIEIIISVAVIGIIAGVTIPSFIRFRNAQLIRNTTLAAVALFDEARSRTLASENLQTYGVYIEAHRLVLFAGSVFSEPQSINKQITLDGNLIISNISLSGGGASVVFDRLSGDTSQYGTLIIGLTSSPIGQKTITITKTGSVSSN